MIKVMKGLKVRADKIRSNIDLTQGQIYSEFILDVLLKKGISRSHAHRLLNNAAGTALKENIPYSEAVLKDKELASLLTKEEVKELFDPVKHFSASKKIIANIVNLFQKIKATYK